MKNWFEEFFEKNDFVFMEFLFFEVFDDRNLELEKFFKVVDELKEE